MTAQSSAVPSSMLRNFARGACSFIRVSPVAEWTAAFRLCSQWPICLSISHPAMATDSAALKQQPGVASGRAAGAGPPVVRSPAAPIARQVGLDRPFFDDKNRAFWILQSAGWAGYFILRSLNGFANAMGAMWHHPHRAADRDRLFADPADGLAVPAADRDEADLDAGPVAGGRGPGLDRLLDHRDVERRDLPEAGP